MKDYYTFFTKEWESNISKMDKNDLIKLLKETLIINNSLLRGQKKSIKQFIDINIDRISYDGKTLIPGDLFIYKLLKSLGKPLTTKELTKIISHIKNSEVREHSVNASFNRLNCQNKINKHKSLRPIQ